MDHVLVAFMLLWSSGLQREEDDSLKEIDEIRLLGGSSRCSGLLQVKSQGVWREVDDRGWDLKLADEVCRQLDCGSAVQASSASPTSSSSRRIPPSCLNSKSTLRKCLTKRSMIVHTNLEIICSDSVRLVNGTSLCSGRLEVKSNHLWSSVCEDDFNLQDAEVVCRELGCGAPSVLQGALYGEVEPPVWSKEFQCGGHESALLDCGSSGSARDTCSSGKSVELTCSEPDNVRLVGGSTRCAGELELKQQGRWRKVGDQTSDWNLKTADVLCEQLDCGSAVWTGQRRGNFYGQFWWITASCLQSESAIRECVSTKFDSSLFNLELKCSDILARPNISFSTYIDGDSEAKQQGLQVLMGSNFTISCSILPQYPGGSFQLIFTNSDTTQNYTLPAVNHSAHFLFSAADHTHQGNYSCVYHICVFSHNFSSESQPLHLTVSASLTGLMIRLVVLVLIVVLSAALFFYCKATEEQMPRREDNIELDHFGGAEDRLGEEPGARGTE